MRGGEKTERKRSAEDEDKNGKRYRGEWSLKNACVAQAFFHLERQLPFLHISPLHIFISVFIYIYIYIFLSFSLSLYIYLYTSLSLSIHPPNPLSCWLAIFANLLLRTPVCGWEQRVIAASLRLLNHDKTIRVIEDLNCEKREWAERANLQAYAKVSLQLLWYLVTKHRIFHRHLFLLHRYYWYSFFFHQASAAEIGILQLWRVLRQK